MFKLRLQWSEQVQRDTEIVATYLCIQWDEKRTRDFGASVEAGVEGFCIVLSFLWKYYFFHLLSDEPLAVLAEHDNCEEATTDGAPMNGHAKNIKAITRQTLEGNSEDNRGKRKGAKRARAVPNSPRIYLPNCQYLMFNVFVRLLILAEGIISTWFMHGWGCVANQILLRLFSLRYHFLHNKSRSLSFTRI